MKLWSNSPFRSRNHEIIRRWENGETMKSIAEDYGISTHRVWQIRNYYKYYKGNAE